jgi:hypothetical protein
VSGWTATIRPSSTYTTALKIQQIVQYGYADTSTASYEEDHLVPLELGGAPSDLRNLWPEPYVATLPDGRNVGARVKDSLETSLKRQVCAGTMTLAAARSRIGIHWVHAYYGIPLAAGATTPPATARPTPRPTLKPTVAPRPASLSVTFVSLPGPADPGLDREHDREDVVRRGLLREGDLAIGHGVRRSRAQDDADRWLGRARVLDLERVGDDEARHGEGRCDVHPRWIYQRGGDIQRAVAGGVCPGLVRVRGRRRELRATAKPAADAARLEPSGDDEVDALTVSVGRSCTQGVRRYHSLVEVGRSSHWLRRPWRRCPAATAERSQQ